MKAVIDRFEDNKAVLRVEGQELIISKTELPKEAKEGSTLFILISEHASEEAAREKMAKTLLNEILNPQK